MEREENRRPRLLLLLLGSLLLTFRQGRRRHPLLSSDSRQPGPCLRFENCIRQPGARTLVRETEVLFMGFNSDDTSKMTRSTSLAIQPGAVTERKEF